MDVDDVLYLAEDIIGTSIGDVNGHNVFNSRDLVRLFQVGGYEDGIAGNGTYLGGDWNLDGEFSHADLLLAWQRGGYSVEVSPARAARPVELQRAGESSAQLRRPLLELAQFVRAEEVDLPTGPWFYPSDRPGGKWRCPDAH